MRVLLLLLDLFLLIIGLVRPPISKPITPPPVVITSSPKKKYELFISFRGSDVRVGFLSHLHYALKRHGIDAFVDEQLDRGEEISKSLLQTIEASYISIVVFSPNYAFSRWCLDELVKIVECREAIGQIVVPVFFGVDPTHVQELTGSYGKALSQHRKLFAESLVESWVHALTKTSEVSGFHPCNCKSEPILIEEIVRLVSEKLHKLFPSHSSYDDNLVGIISRVKSVMLLLCFEDVNVVGIWGVGGIGKTTIAQATFDQICGQFEAKCFVENVREKYKRGVDILHYEILPKLLGTSIFMSDNSIIRRRLSRKQVLVVLDDVSDFGQIKSITANYFSYCGPGSKLILTSRDKQLLKTIGAEIYEVKLLNDLEALQLFCLHAFKEKVPRKGYLGLSKRVIEYAQGLPLALEVYGSNLSFKSKTEWEDELEILKGNSDERIRKVLRTSYDELCKNDRELFLDIACFHIGKYKDRSVDILGVGSETRISRLCDKSLISIQKNKLHMHDVIQQMAKDITCEKQKLKKRSRLWNPRDIYFLLTKGMGSEATRCISLDLSKIKDIYLGRNAFERMFNLQYLEFYESSYPNNNNNWLCSDIEDKYFGLIMKKGTEAIDLNSFFQSTDIKVHLPEGLDYLPEKLRCFRWDNYPCKFFPFTGVNGTTLVELVELYLWASQLEQLWDGVQNFPDLKRLSLRHSEKLTKIGDMSKAQKLEVIDLAGCSSLCEIHSSIKLLRRLKRLDLSGCSSLFSLPSLENLESLEYLILGGSGINELPQSNCSLKRLKCLDVSHCKNLIHLPESLGNLESLEILYADGSSIQKLPESICNLKKLREVNLSYCANLTELPQEFGNLKSLEQFEVRGSGITELPGSICNLEAANQWLDVSKCFNLRRLPQNLEGFGYLKELVAAGSGIKEVPSSINYLNELMVLDLSRCPDLILPPLTGPFLYLVEINLNDCNLFEFPPSLCSVTSLESLYLGGNDFVRIPESIKQLWKLEILDLHCCRRLKCLPESINELRRLKMLDISGCTSLDCNFYSNTTENRFWAIAKACVSLGSVKDLLIVRVCV